MTRKTTRAAKSHVAGEARSILITPRTCAAVATGVILVMASGCAASSVEQQIRAVLHEQADAWNRGDIDGYMRHYWKSESLTFSSGGTTRHGWKATRDRYHRRYPTPERMGELSFEVSAVRLLADDAALLLGNWHLSREPDPVGGNFSLVFQKRDGRWLIIHDHTSTAATE